MQAILYSRISIENSEKVERHLQEMRSYCDDNNISIIEEISDDGISGTKKRDNLSRAVEMCDSNTILLCTERARVFRDELEIAIIERVLRKKGSRIVSTRLGDTGDTISSRLTNRIMDLLSEHESSLQGERRKQANRMRRQKGLTTSGTVPYGKKALDEDGRRLLIDNEEELKVIKIIKELKGLSYSNTKIAKALNNNGYKTRNGLDFKDHHVKNIYQNKGD